ncbi:MAG: dTMP kinase [Actinobacteria bacterium]|nr:dTMP kinase [Actinomycetota bacterium]
MEKRKMLNTVSKKNLKNQKSTMKYKVNLEIDLKRNPYKGKYIAFEGIDGAGKTIQVEKLTDYLERKKKKVWNLHEPTRTDAIGEIIHEFLNGNLDLPPQSVQYLYTADRIYQLENLTIPALKKGNIVLSQRCFWSSVPYGMIDRSNGKFDDKKGQNLLVALSILSAYTQVIAPDITVFLDVSAEEAHKRLQKIGIKEHYDKLGMLKELRKGYKWLIKKFPKEFIVINGDQPVEKVQEDLIKALEKRFNF